MQPKLTMLMCYVRDLGVSVRFYTEVLGLEPELVTPGFAQLKTGTEGVTLGLHPVRPGEAVEPQGHRIGWTPSFEVADLDEARRRLDQVGAKHDAEAHEIPGGLILGIADPDGNRVSLEQRIKLQI